jgi:hypothetical protein
MLDELLVRLLSVLPEVDPARESEGGRGKFGFATRLRACRHFRHLRETLATSRGIR